ncbi:hypothetical protein PG985_005998 [Apiospora marii]|uniref:Secreted protein n=1 Tax=Apiospora marii TaxID=335849 RepID=A0ABR1S6D9_9PEZI
MAICYRLQHKTDLVTTAVAIAIAVAVVAGEQVAVLCEIVYWVLWLCEPLGAKQATIPPICSLAAQLVRGDAQCSLFSRKRSSCPIP